MKHLHCVKKCNGLGRRLQRLCPEMPDIARPVEATFMTASATPAKRRPRGWRHCPSFLEPLGKLGRITHPSSVHGRQIEAAGLVLHYKRNIWRTNQPLSASLSRFPRQQVGISSERSGLL